MKNKVVAIVLFIIISAFSFLYAENPEVRVRIMYTEDNVFLSSSSKIQILNQNEEKINLRGNKEFRVILEDNELKLIDPKDNILISGDFLEISNSDRNNPLCVKQVPFGIGWFWAGQEDRTYYGNLEFYPNEDNKIDVISILDMEAYLLGVVPSEIGSNSPLEALKAQTLCARSEATIGLETGKYSGAHHMLTADIYCQVYSGVGKTSDAVRKAVSETRGEILIADGKTMAAYYASNCGGHSENIENVWPDRSKHAKHWSGNPDKDGSLDLNLTQAEDVREWVNTIPDTWCKPSELTPEWSKEHYRWQRTIAPEELSKIVANKIKDIGLVYDIIPIERGVSGRIYDLLFIGTEGHCRLNGELNIRMLWESPLKSSCFVVDKIGPIEKPVSFIIKGAGWGHGVGMCQTGAIAQANAGRTYKQILTHYFRGSTIEKRY